MGKMLAILVLAVCLAVGLAPVCRAAPMGTAFTYQGRLLDANSAADGLYDLTFRLYESEVGETRAANDVNVGDVNVSDGYFTVELDFGNGAFDGDGRWLEIGVRPGEMNDPNVYTTLSPRQEVTPTPYALQTRGIFVDDSGNVGIGTKFPDKKLTVANGGFAVYPGPVGLSDPIIITDDLDIKLGDIGGMQNEVSLVISDSDNKFVFNNGNVGIGASAPDSLLSLEKQGQASSAPQIKIKGYYPGSGGGSYLVMGKSRGAAVGDNQTTASGDPLGLIDTLGINVNQNESTATRIMFKQDGMASFAYVPGRIEFYTSNGSSGPAEHMRIDKDGNVGIGTDSPQSKLEVAGWTRTQALEITGGSDLAETFHIRGETPIEPGMVVSIDPKWAGRLMVSTTAYDRKVAGIVSGAGGVKVGMVMGQKGSEADGSELIALTGRAYCWADASGAPIESGDLLTTSNIPGHAMKVADYTKAQGAILGKAMSSLEKDRGLVLVLVTLQ